MWFIRENVTYWPKWNYLTEFCQLDLSRVFESTENVKISLKPNYVSLTFLDIGGKLCSNFTPSVLDTILISLYILPSDVSTLPRWLKSRYAFNTETPFGDGKGEHWVISTVLPQHFCRSSDRCASMQGAAPENEPTSCPLRMPVPCASRIARLTCYGGKLIKPAVSSSAVQPLLPRASLWNGWCAPGKNLNLFASWGLIKCGKEMGLRIGKAIELMDALKPDWKMQTESTFALSTLMLLRGLM